MGIDYTVVLADLREKRALVDAAIRGLEGVAAGRIPAPRAPVDSSPPGSFEHMTITDAAIVHLSRVRRQQRTSEIMRALLDGGIVTASDDFRNTLGSTLLRASRTGTGIVRLARGVWRYDPAMKR